ncbi:MAG: mannosyltransferase family protein [Acidimicrobiales bacterium]
MSDSSSITSAPLESLRNRVAAKLRSRWLTSPEAQRPWAEKWWSPLLIFGSIGVLVWIAIWYGNNHLMHDAFFPVRNSIGETWFGGFARWDAEWYRTIAREGYVYYPDVQSSIAFWPTYPVVIRLFSWAFPSIFITGTVITVFAGATAVVLLRKWAKVFVSTEVAITSVVLLCVFPYSWYLYGVVYSDALFVATAIGAFYLVERDKYFWAGIVGIAATAGRPAGLVVAIALVLRVIERRNQAQGALGLRELFSPRSLTRADTPIFFSLAGVGAWCIFLWVRFGDPFLFATIQESTGWDQGAGLSTWLKFRLIEELQRHPFAWSTVGLVAHGLVVLGALLLLPRVQRRFGWAYAAYTLGLVSLPLLGSKDFFGAGRYLLPAFPCIVIAAELLVARPKLRLAVLPLSLVAMLAMAVAFGRGSYIS